MTEPGISLNPFPGLRPFEPDEDHLFFGREEEVDELLHRLRSNRFLAVVGTSGCGKSSLVRSGLIPSLHSGFVVKAGSSWRVAILRPGEDPIGHLAAALDGPAMISAPTEDLVSTNRVLLDAALRRGTMALVEAVRDAQLPSGDNVLIVVDQFEELFRFRNSDETGNPRDEAMAFVKLLLEAAAQQEVPIYVVLTMRADFVGECVEYPGLPEALNASQYLVPRLTRDELRSAIMGPVAVAGGRIAPRLVVRILNDLGNDQNQLPVLQHALMRTWEYWQRSETSGGPIDIAHYDAVGTLRDALSRHAEEAYRDVGSEPDQLIAERIFKALTDTVADPRGTRRPCTVATLAAVADVPDATVLRIVELFRRPGRSFLMPPPDVPLARDVIVDLSHESLMRCWARLIAWTEEERASASIYFRLSRAAGWHDEGTAGLWRDPELELGLRWKAESRPSAAWARRYDESFDRAMRFLEHSERERDRERAERTASRRRRARQLQATVVVLAGLLLYAVWSNIQARRSNALAEQNLRDAVRAVDESLRLADRDPARLGIDHAEVIAFRRELAERARNFYAEFVKRGVVDEALRQAVASAHFGLGQANRVLGDQDEAASDYRTAIARFQDLARDFPATARYRRDLANAYTFLGEALRASSEQSADAQQAYESALQLQQALRREDPGNVAYQQDLARASYNRGILLAETPDGFDRAAADFREAIRLLEPLASGSAPAAQELSRSFNNLGSLLNNQDRPLAEVEELYARAVRTHDSLAALEPANREYRLELTKFYVNLGDIQRERGLADAARRSNDRAFELIELLSRPAASLDVDLADSYMLRARIAETRDWRLAAREYERALGLFERLARDPQAHRIRDFHLRFGDLLVDLGLLTADHAAADVRRLFSRAAAAYGSIAETVAESGRPAEAQWVVDTMTRLMQLPNLPDRQRAEVEVSYKEVEPKLRTRAAKAG